MRSNTAAPNITMKLTSDRDFITLQIADDGTGFDQKQQSAGTGLRIMAYRAELIRGNLTSVGSILTVR